MKVPGIPAPVKAAVDSPGVDTTVAQPADGDDGTSAAAGSVVAELMGGGSVGSASVGGGSVPAAPVSPVSTGVVSMASLETVSLGSVVLAAGPAGTLDDGAPDCAVDESSLEQDVPSSPTTTATVPRRRSVDALVLTSRATYRAMRGWTGFTNLSGDAVAT